MIRRLGEYLRGSYPPVLSTGFALCWAYGVTGLFALLDPAPGAWRSGPGSLVVALTVVVDLLLMRVIDDIRDLPYDRALHPTRPLARGAVQLGDLVALYAAGTGLILVLNAGHGPAAAVIAGQLAYALLVLWVHQRWHWPDGARLGLSLLVSSPGPVLLHGYLYAEYLRATGHPAGAALPLGIAVALLAAFHPELAKKIVRIPRPGERTYVRAFGLPATVSLALLAPLASAALLFAGARPWSPALLLVLLPLAFPLTAAVRFRDPTVNRWSARSAGFFLLTTFAGYALAALLG
jgi:hypothetical protein